MRSEQLEDGAWEEGRQVGMPANLECSGGGDSVRALKSALKLLATLMQRRRKQLLASNRLTKKSNTFRVLELQKDFELEANAIVQSGLFISFAQAAVAAARTICPTPVVPRHRRLLEADVACRSLEKLEAPKEPAAALRLRHLWACPRVM